MRYLVECSRVEPAGTLSYSICDMAWLVGGLVGRSCRHGTEKPAGSVVAADLGSEEEAD